MKKSIAVAAVLLAAGIGCSFPGNISMAGQTENNSSYGDLTEDKNQEGSSEPDNGEIESPNMENKDEEKGELESESESEESTEGTTAEPDTEKGEEESSESEINPDETWPTETETDKIESPGGERETESKDNPETESGTEAASEAAPETEKASETDTGESPEDMSESENYNPSESITETDTERQTENVEKESMSVPEKEIIKNREADVVTLQIPQRVGIVIDPWEIGGNGQIYSEQYIIRNSGKTAGTLTLSNFIYALGRESEVVIRLDERRIYDGGEKAIYMEMKLGNGDTVVFSPEGTEYVVRLEPEEELLFWFSGTANENASSQWRDNDVAVTMKYSWETEEDKEPESISDPETETGNPEQESASDFESIPDGEEQRAEENEKD